MRSITVLASLIGAVAAHEFGNDGGGAEEPEPWVTKYGKQVDLPFSGPLSFSHLPYAKCLDDPFTRFDIAILGFPYDTSVSYRPGARFGPFGIRAGSRRQRPERGQTFAWGINPYTQQNTKVIDCGDIPISPFDNALALDQMTTAYSTLISRPVHDTNAAPHTTVSGSLSRTGKTHPRIVSLGGDHTVVLPILRSLKEIYGPVSVIHFDAHLDTWSPVKNKYPGASTSPQSQINHGTFFWKAAQEGLLALNSSIHAGIRCKLASFDDVEHDRSVGFELITTDDIDDIGVAEIVQRIRRRVGSTPVYLSLDIDVLDPSTAPATGTPEAGGWTTREVKRILRGLAGLNFIGFDLVEVAPAYDTNAEITGLVAADIVHEFLSMMIHPRDPMVAAATAGYRPVSGSERDEL